jgi:exopolyphosphatase/guanosine-5'-triphosphate,3'-diphosphate pyrophosphatase
MAQPAEPNSTWTRREGEQRRRIAIIDIGSNSIRLVVYAGAARAPLPIFNEKVLCGMGRRLHSTGRLDPEGAEQALLNLPRFAAVARALGARRLRVVATAAIRDASDGAAFVARARQRSGLQIDVISGEQEAHFSALGVISSHPEAEGAVGDLGGGSLELVRIDRGVLGPQVTLPLGPQRLSEAEAAGEDVGELIKDSVRGLGWLEQVQGKVFYAIGGAWRALARIHMAQTNYRLHVIDGYSVVPQAFADFLHLVSRMSDAQLRQLPEVPTKRLYAMRPAARFLRQILRVARPRRLVFSAQGLREGIVYDELPEATRREDPLLAAAADIARQFSRFASLGPVLDRWTDGLFLAEAGARRRWRAAACLLSDIGWIDHPDYRGRLAFDRVLTLPLPGLDHSGRTFLAHALHARYENQSPAKLARIAIELGLSEEDLAAARTLGRALRLGHTIAAGDGETLASSTLVAGDAQLTLRVPFLGDAYAGESVAKRLDELANGLDLDARIVAQSDGRDRLSA